MKRKRRKRNIPVEKGKGVEANVMLQKKREVETEMR
jgi:hypothetical protein